MQSKQNFQWSYCTKTDLIEVSSDFFKSNKNPSPQTLTLSYFLNNEIKSATSFAKTLEKGQDLIWESQPLSKADSRYIFQGFWMSNTRIQGGFHALAKEKREIVISPEDKQEIEKNHMRFLFSVSQIVTLLDDGISDYMDELIHLIHSELSSDESIKTCIKYNHIIYSEGEIDAALEWEAIPIHVNSLAKGEIRIGSLGAISVANRKLMDEVSWQVGLALEQLENKKALITLNEGLESEVRFRTEALSKAYNSLKRRGLLLSQIQNLSETGGWSYDIQRQKLWWSDSLFHLHELEVHKSIKVNDIKFLLKNYSSELKERLEGLILKTIETGIGFETEYSFINSKGEKRWVYALVSTQTNELNQLTSIYGSLMDITKRKSIEDTLKTSMKYFQALFDTSPIPMLILEQDIKKPLTSLNEAFHHLIDNLNDEKKSFETLFNEILTENAKQVFNQRWLPHIFERGKKSGPRYLPTIEIINNKTNQYIEGTAILIGIQILLVFRDVTAERKSEQAQFKALEKAEQAVKAKSVFLANMSHEIRTPMNAILGFSQLLQEQIKDHKYRNYLEAINNSGQTLLNIINDILDLSKIEAGKVEIVLEPTNIYQFQKEISNLMSLAYKKKGLLFKVSIDEKCPQWLFLDNFRLRQVALNLLSNALKHTLKGFVLFDIYYKETSKEGGQLYLSVKDSGLGISLENQKQVFEAFEQVGSLQTVSGTGLGLSIISALVHLMEGSIQLKSEINAGSTFTVNLPVKLSDPPVRATLIEPVCLEFKPSKILIVDDVENNLILIEAFLEPFPFQVLKASNGLEALELSKENIPDLILMDIKMPKMNGVQALKSIRTVPKLEHIPIIALTAFGLKKEEDKFIEIGFNAYLRKPINKNTLLTTIHNYRGHLCQLPSDLEKPTDRYVEKTKPASTINTEKLRSVIQNELMPQYELIKESFITSEIEDFATYILLVSEEFKLDKLKDWGQGLLTQIQEFNIDAAHQTLKEIKSHLDIH